MQDKLVQLVLEHEKQLLASSYGRFFVRRLRLHLYRKDAAAWKQWEMSDEARAPRAPEPSAPSNVFGFLRARRVDAPQRKKKASKADEQLAGILAAID